MSEQHATGMGATFRLDAARCTGCGLCVADCPAEIISLIDNKAAIPPESADDCIGCQHCLAICPEAAVSILGRKPEDSWPLKGFKPDYANLEKLVRGRRSVRQFAPEAVEPAILREVLHAASYAPTGVNSQGSTFTVIQNPAAMAEYRDRTARAIIEAEGSLPEAAGWFADCGRDWVEKGQDTIYRGAPHLVVASSCPDAPCAQVDPVIALSYLDLLAQARGLGTVWAGIAFGILNFVPETRKWLGIPEDHILGYAMLIGKPMIKYARTVQREPENLTLLSKLEG